MDIRIGFGGLATLVRTKRRILLVNASTPRQSSVNPSVTIPAHVPILCIPPKDHTATITPLFTFRHDFVDPLQTNPVEYAVYDLRRRFVQLSAVTSTFNLIDGAVQHGSTPVQGTNDRFLFWLTSLVRLLGNVNVKSAVWSNPPSDELATSVDIDGATVSAGGVDVINEYVFLNADPANYERFHAETIEAAYTLDDKKQAVISVTSMGGDAPFQITLTPANGKSIRMMVINDILEDLLLLSPKMGPGQPLYHFERMVDLFDVGAKTPLPIPIRVTGTNGGRGGAGGCGPPGANG